MFNHVSMKFRSLNINNNTDIIINIKNEVKKVYDRKRVLALIIIIIIIIVAIATVVFYSTQNTNQNPQPSGPQISGNNSSNATNVTSGVSVISIQNMTFNPDSLTVKTGTNVQWVNRDNTQHQIVSDSGAFKSEVLSNGESWNFFFAKAGVYGYHCGIHPNETGTITVQG